MMDDTTDAYVRTLENEINNKNEQLKNCAQIIKELYEEARPGHLEYIRRMYDSNVMAEHAQGVEDCEICKLLKRAKEFYSREGVTHGYATKSARVA